MVWFGGGIVVWGCFCLIPVKGIRYFMLQTLWEHLGVMDVQVCGGYSWLAWSHPDKNPLRWIKCSDCEPVGTWPQTLLWKTTFPQTHSVPSTTTGASLWNEKHCASLVKAFLSINESKPAAWTPCRTRDQCDWASTDVSLALSHFPLQLLPIPLFCSLHFSRCYLIWSDLPHITDNAPLW